VFLTAGESEDVLSPMMPPAITPVFLRGDVASFTERLGVRLAARIYPRLGLTTHIFRGETHLTVAGIAYAHGLRTLFKRDRLSRGEGGA
jgi:hypothetical protein